jgi:hypothetical protein
VEYCSSGSERPCQWTGQVGETCYVSHSAGTNVDSSAATLRTNKPENHLNVPQGPSAEINTMNTGLGLGRPRSPGVAGLLSPAPLWHGTHISGGTNGQGGGFHTHLVPPGISHSPAHGHQAPGAVGYNTPHSMMRAFPDMGGVGGVSPNLTPSFSNPNSSDGKVSSELPVSPMPMYTAGEGMASIGLTPFTSGSEAATLPQVRGASAVCGENAELTR